MQFLKKSNKKKNYKTLELAFIARRPQQLEGQKQSLPQYHINNKNKNKNLVQIKTKQSKLSKVMI